MDDTAMLDRLQALDACAVSDALDRLGIRGVAHGLSAVSVRRRIAGRVSTVLLGPAGEGAAARHLCTAAVDAADASTVIAVAHQGRRDAAGWGGILSLAARLRGVRGVVIDGACRDADESRACRLPVYATGTTPVTARGRVAEQAWNVPVVIAGIQVAPGDWVIADASGTVFIPVASIEQVLSQAEAIAAREQAIASAVRQGRSAALAMGGDYEHMLER